MLISLYQMQPVSGDAAANLAKIAQAAEAASDMGAELLVAPELAVSGYGLTPERFAEIAEGRDGERQDLARQAGKLLAGGVGGRGGSHPPSLVAMPHAARLRCAGDARRRRCARRGEASGRRRALCAAEQRRACRAARARAAGMWPWTLQC